MSCFRTQHSVIGEALTTRSQVKHSTIGPSRSSARGHIVYAGYTICSSRKHIDYGAFCGSTVQV